MMLQDKIQDSGPEYRSYGPYDMDDRFVCYQINLKL